MLHNISLPAGDVMGLANHGRLWERRINTWLSLVAVRHTFCLMKQQITFTNQRLIVTLS